MSAAFASAWPGSRVLLGWRRELRDRQPRQLWFSRLLLHRVEAPFLIAHAYSLDRWQAGLLRLLVGRLPAVNVADCLADARLDRQLLTQFIRELIDADLLRQNGSGLWNVTESGRRALETGSRLVRSEERRTVYFVDNTELQRSPNFLPLQRPLRPASGKPPAPPIRFEIANLEACIEQTPQWKARRQFPVDVESLASPAADWRRVVFVALEPLALLLLRTAESGVLGFAVRVEGWKLEPEPILSLTGAEEDVLPDLAVEPSPEAWHKAWRTWCQPRGLPPDDIEACRLEPSEHRLRVQAPPRLVEHLRTARSDAIKQEAWLLAGDGRTRWAAQIDLQPFG